MERTSLEVTQEWKEFILAMLLKSRQLVAEQAEQKFPNSGNHFEFLHIDLCIALNAVFEMVPNKKYAMEFVQGAIEEMSEIFEDKWNTKNTSQ